MAAITECACSGIRTCLLCEEKQKSIIGLRRLSEGERFHPTQQYLFCSVCENTFSYGQNCTHLTAGKGNSNLPNHVKFEGVTVIPDFISIDEEALIVKDIDNTSWKPSQSGRRKQVNCDGIILLFTCIQCNSDLQHP